AGTVPDFTRREWPSVLSLPGRFWRRLSGVVAGGVGVYATEYVLERYGRELPPESLAVKIVASLFLQPVPWRRRSVALVVLVATFISLVAAGWIFTALIYLVASLFFRLIRTACRQRFEGREPCQS
ncbi:phage lysis protein LysA, partial [Escherichia coli H120]